MLRRVHLVPSFSDDELERELTITAAARTVTRQRLFDTLLAELERRRQTRGRATVSA
jgi:hypothetical protein